MSTESKTPEGDLAGMRKVYDREGLERRALESDPIVMLGTWLDEARAAGEPEANAMVLATVDADGKPAARVVLLKGLDDQGLRFFTNHESEKGRHLAALPNAAVCFLWHKLHRQVRVTGAVARLGDGEAQAYFDSRPRGSRIAAWASPQSQAVDDRNVLASRVAKTKARFGDGPIPLPPFWGGYCLRPRTLEFWQGRPDRLHDRFRYTAGERGWTVARLAP